MFLSTWHPHPLIFSAGPIHLYWYGLLLAIGAIAGLLVIIRLGKKVHLESAWLTDLFIALVIGGFIGARLYHVLNEWNYYFAHPTEIWRIWNGGLAIHGAMIAGLVVLIFMARRKKVSAWLLADVIAIGLVIGQAIGRWGNYFNQELFGRPTNLPWKIFIDEANRPTGSLGSAFYHPAFLYESLGCLIIFLILYWIFSQTHRDQIKKLWRLWSMSGSIFLTYLILYSLLRLAVETTRIDRVPVIAGVRLPLLTSVIIIITAAIIWIARVYKHRRHVHPN